MLNDKIKKIKKQKNNSVQPELTCQTCDIDYETKIIQ